MKQKKGLLYSVGVCILILVAVGFFVTPLAEILGPNSRSSITFGKYAGRGINYIPGNYFAQQVEIAAGTLSQPGQSIDDFTARLIWREGFDAATVHVAIIEELQQSRVGIAEKTLDRRIAQHPNFQGADGFDIEVYQSLNAQERSRFRDLERELALREIYISDITDGTLLSDGERDFFRDIALEERQIAFTVVADDQISDEQISAYAADNANLFERVRVAVIEIADRRRSAEQIQTQILDDGSNFYEKQSEFSTTEELSVANESEWLFFSELADRYPNADEELEQLRTIPFKQPSSLIEYGDGQQYAIFLVEERERAIDSDQTELNSYVRNYIDTRDPEYRAQRLLAVMEERRALVETAVDSNSSGGGSASLESVGLQNGFTVEVSDYFPLNYGSIDLYPAVASDNEGYLDGVERNREFLKQVFSLPRGGLSAPILHRDNAILFQVADIRAVDASEYDTFADFYQSQLLLGTEESLDSVLVQRDRLFDNFDAIYNEFIVVPEPSARDEPVEDASAEDASTDQ